MKTIISITTFLLFIFSTVHAQTENAGIINLLNRTEVSVRKAQKEMMSGQATKNPQQFSLAVKYQVLAVEAYKKQDFAAAACYSSKSREYSISLLSNLAQSELKFYLINDDEIKIIQNSNCRSLSGTTIISNDLIEDSIMMDPTKLSANYKISIN